MEMFLPEKLIVSRLLQYIRLAINQRFWLCSIITCFFVFLTSFQSHLHAQSCDGSTDVVIYNEAFSGDITGVAANPLLINLPVPYDVSASYVVIGSAPDGDRDAITFVVPVGAQLNMLNIDTHIPCAAIDRLVIWQGPDNSGPLLFNSGNAGYISGNLGPLSSGQYTLLINQNADVGPSPDCSITCYRIEFQLVCADSPSAPVPDPLTDGACVGATGDGRPRVRVLLPGEPADFEAIWTIQANPAGITPGTEFYPGDLISDILTVPAGNRRTVRLESGAPVGVYEFCARVRDRNTGCEGEVTCGFEISVFDFPEVSCPADADVCANSGLLDLTTLSPAIDPSGGTFAGPGVVGEDFDPSISGSGIHTITYDYTDENGCSGSCEFNITVLSSIAAPTPDPLTDEACEGVEGEDQPRIRVILPGAATDFEAVWTIGNNPAGLTPGTVYGPGDNVPGILAFNATNRRTARLNGTAPVGTYEFCAQIRDRNNGCLSETVCGFEITLHALPQVICPADTVVCDGNGLLDLLSLNSEASPSGGTFDGPGVTGNEFDPSSSGVGFHSIAYEYTDQNGCSGSCDFGITVISSPASPIPDPLTDAACIGVEGEDQPRVRVILPGSATDFEAIWTIGNNPAGLTPGTVYGPGDNVPGILTFNTTNRRTARLDGTAPTGTYEFCAQIRDRNTGCLSEEVCGFEITLHPLPVETCPADAIVCTADGIQDLFLFFPGDAPSGGTFDGPGVTDNEFDPEDAGVGFHTITFEYTDDNGCNSICVFDITVLESPEPPTPDPLTDEACVGVVGEDQPRVRVILPGAVEDFETVWTIGSNPAELTPGTVYGPGNNVPGILTFNTTNRRTARLDGSAPTGVYEFCAQIRDRNNGCLSEAVCGFTITLHALPEVICPADTAVCEGEASFDLLSLSPVADPSGGIFMGPGVSGTDFSPVSAGAGNHMIVYEYTDSNGCTNSCDFTVTVIDNPLAPVPDPLTDGACEGATGEDRPRVRVVLPGEPEDFEAIWTIGANPAGITPGTEFYPGDEIAGILTIADGNRRTVRLESDAPVGVYEFCARIRDRNTGCESDETCGFEISVFAFPVVSCPEDTVVCSNADLIDLTTLTPNADPSGGIFEGPGISGNDFDPSIAGTGTHTITYEYTDENGCSSSCQFEITVNASPDAPTPDPLTDGACEGATGADRPRVRVVLPGDTADFEAIWTINDNPAGITPGTEFYPGDEISGVLTLPAGNRNTVRLESDAPVGVYEFCARIRDRNNGCESNETCGFEISVFEYPVVTCPSDMTVCTAEGILDLTELSTPASPAGGTFSGTGVSGNEFDPVLAGTGSYTIFYDYTDENGCSGSCEFEITVNSSPDAPTPDPLSDEACEGVEGEDQPRVRVLLPGAATDFEAVWTIGSNPAGLTPGTVYGPGNNVPGILTFNASNRRTARLDGTAPTGTYEFCAQIRDRNNDCLSEAVCGFEITLHALPVVTCPADTVVCDGDGILDLLSLLPAASPAGGIFNGTGVTGDEFDPESAGSGPHTITYEYTDENGCTDSCEFEITVNSSPDAPTPDPLTDEACEGVEGEDQPRVRVILPGDPTDFEAIWTIGSNPAGLTPGTVYGPGDNVPGILGFNATNRRTARLEGTAPTGTYEFCAQIRDRITGCLSEETCGFTITLNPQPVVTCPADTVLCNDDDIIDLLALSPAASPSGGTFDGPGVSGNNFDPEIAGIGDHTISYEFTDINGCSNTCSFTITVNAGLTAPTPDPLTDEACEGVEGEDQPRVRVLLPGDPEDFEAIWTIGSNPAGLTPGTVYGPGDNVPGILGFNAMNRRTARLQGTAPTGSYEFCAQIRDRNTGCVSEETCGFVITLYPLPVVTCPEDTLVCASDGIINLLSLTPSADPAGGIFTGSGVSGDNFDPVAAGEGPHLINYTFTTIDGCADSCQFTITVDLEPEVMIVFNNSPEGGCQSGETICSGEPTDVTFMLINADQLIITAIQHETESNDGDVCPPGATNGYGPLTGGTLSVNDDVADGITQSFVNTTGEKVRISFRVEPRSSTGAMCVGEFQWVHIVVEPTPELINCPLNILAFTSDDGTGDCATDVAWEHPVVDPGCEPVTLEISIDGNDSFTVTPGGDIMENFERGTYTISYLATDGFGNEAACSFVLTVEDDEAPTFDPSCQLNETFSTDVDGSDCPEDATTMLMSGDILSTSDTYEVGGITMPSFDTCISLIDNCDGVEDLIVEVVSIDIDDSEMPCQRTITISFQISDLSGNMSTTFINTFNFVDDTNPVFPRPEDRTLTSLNDGATCPGTAEISLVVDRDNPIALGNESFTFTVHGVTIDGPVVYSDNCSYGSDLSLYVWNLFEDWEGPADECERNIRVVWRVYDACGNFQQRQQIFTIIDDESPTVVCLSGTIFLDPNGEYTLAEEDVLDMDLSGDNCTEIMVTDIFPIMFTCKDLDQTFEVNVTVSDLCGNESECTAIITVEQGTALPEPWESDLIGANISGNAEFYPCDGNTGQFVISTTGFTSSTANQDQQHFVHQELCGDGSIVARFVSIDSLGWMGIQFREDTIPGSKKVVMKTQLNNFIHRQVRALTNGSTQTQTFPRNAHTWFRLERTGNIFVGYSSPNGINWSFRMAATVPMDTCILVGLMVESINSLVTNTAIFDNVTVTGTDEDNNLNMTVIPRTTTTDISQVSIKVYPNPTFGLLYFELPEDMYSDNTSVIIYNSIGQIVKQAPLVNTELQSVDLASPAGVYLISIVQEGKVIHSERIVKH